MLDAVDKIRSYVRDMDESAFASDSRSIDAVVRNLEIIGEASKHVPQNIAGLYTDADWRRIGEMRNKLIHDYAETNIALVWETVISRLGPLKDALEEMLDQIDD
jgi:uncharacterized protein with HEPN domain